MSDTIRIRRTWTYTAEVPAGTPLVDEHGCVPERLETEFMEAYTQGDGDFQDEVVA